MKTYAKPEVGIFEIMSEDVLLDSIDLPIDEFDEEAPPVVQEP